MDVNEYAFIAIINADVAFIPVVVISIIVVISISSSATSNSTISYNHTASIIVRIPKMRIGKTYESALQWNYISWYSVYDLAVLLHQVKYDLLSFVHILVAMAV